MKLILLVQSQLNMSLKKNYIHTYIHIYIYIYIYTHLKSTYHGFLKMTVHVV